LVALAAAAEIMLLDVMADHLVEVEGLATKFMDGVRLVTEADWYI
jgi:hypothetical protein